MRAEKGYKGGVMPFMDFSDRDPIPRWDSQEPGARLKPWLRELSFWRHDTSTPVNKQGVKLYKSLPLGTFGRSLADQCSEDQICSGQGFDLIIGAIRHHFRSYLVAEPEVQAETALYQSTRSPKGTFVEYTSRTSNKLREMESGFKELLPPKLKAFIVKRQAKLTHDQAKHLHFYIPTRGLEADKMVDALNRLDQTDALVEQILGDRVKLEHHVNRGHAHPNSQAQAYPMEAETTTSSESNHHHNHKTSSDTESDQLDWDPERIDDDGYPLVDETGSTLVPVPREGPLEEDEACSLTACAQGYREVRKNLRDSVTGRGYYKPESSRHKKVVRKTMFEKEPPRRDRHIRTPFPRQSERSQHRTCHWSRVEKTRTRCYRCRQLGHMARECQNPALEDIPQSSAKNFFLPGDAFAQLHNLSSYMWFDGASRTVLECNSDPKHSEFIGLVLRPARGLTDTGAQQLVVGASAALRWCDRLLKRHGLVPVDVTPSNMIATCGGIGTAKVVQVLDFLAGIVVVNGVMRFLVLEEPMSADGRQQFIPPLTPITMMRQLGANIRMKDSGAVLEIEDDHGTTHTEKLVRERSGHLHNQLHFFSREGWKLLPDSLRAQLKFDPFMAGNRHEKCSYGKYEFKDEKRASLVPTAECYGLDALETLKTVEYGFCYSVNRSFTMCHPHTF